MNFNKLVNSIIHESQQLMPIISGDGGRQIYTACVYYGNEHYVYLPTQALTLNEDDTYDWDDNFRDYGAIVLFTTNSFDEALMKFDDDYLHRTQQYPQFQNAPPLTDEVINKIQQTMGHIIGTWKVIDDDANAGSLMLGVEVDINAYRASINHAQGDLLGF
jgi:hypothetical protein